MSQCADCGQPMHPHQVTCGSCGAPVRRRGRSPRTFDVHSFDEHEEFVLGDEPFSLESEDELHSRGRARGPLRDGLRREWSGGEERGHAPGGGEPGARERLAGERRDAPPVGEPLPHDASSRPPAGAKTSTGGPSADVESTPTFPLEPRRPPPVPARARSARAPGPAGDAAFFSRAWALVVDVIVLLVASRLLSVVATLAIRAAEAVSGETELYDDVLVEQLTHLGTLALVASYFVFLHAGEGQTVGKGLVGVRVVRATGEPLDHLQSLLRLVGYVFSALPFLLGFLVAAIAPHRGLHDYLAGTIVVRVGREPVAPEPAA